jgi:WD40 repeat protein
LGCNDPFIIIKI